MYKKFKAYIIQGALDKTDDIFLRSQIELTFTLTFAFAVLYTAMLGHFSTLDTSLAFDIVNIVSWIWVVSIFFVIRMTKSHFWGGFSFLIMGMVVSSSMIFLAKGQPTAESGVWHGFGIISGFLLLGRRWGFISAGYYIVVTVLMILDNANSWRLFDIGLDMGFDVGKDPVAAVIPMTSSAFMLGHFLLTRNKAQQLIAEQKKHEVEHRQQLQIKNQEITDSITYAKRIQQAILPPDKRIQQCIPNSFVLYKPKDIVAGDFYWLEQIGGQTIIAAADCTGHGVPGAMVSVVCHNALNRSVREFNLKEPAAILNKTRELVVETFEHSEDEVKDGMDIALCNISDTTLQYAGANNPLYHISNGQLNEIKPSKQSIGKQDTAEPYQNTSIPATSGDVFYLFTDGFADQFGGPKGKKFKYKPFKELLLTIHSKPMAEQKQLLDEAIEKWKGNLEQVDDICIIGVTI
jgi:serine phosphatase RsbU (regulator of sigma subunit)